LGTVGLTKIEYSRQHIVRTLWNFTLTAMITSVFTLRRLGLIAGLGVVFTLSSCVSPYYGGPNQRVGGVLGAATGALAGAVIGNQSDRPLEGAAIGGVVGALAGSALGGVQDEVVYGRSYPQSYGYSPAPVYYGGPSYSYYSPAPVIVQRSYTSSGYGYGWGGGSCYRPSPCAPVYRHSYHCR
jgi:hypothetical protein